MNPLSQKTLNETFFSQLLQYKKQLVDGAFAAHVMRQVDRFLWMRWLILMGSGLFAAIFLSVTIDLAMIESVRLLTLDIGLIFKSIPIALYSTEMMTLILLSSVVLASIWVLADDI